MTEDNNIKLHLQRLQLSQISDLETIHNLYERCKSELLKSGINQWGNWGNNYPNLNFLHQALLNNELFVFNNSKEIVGAVELNNKASKEWAPIQWSSTLSKPLIIHALVIDPDEQNRGYGKLLVTQCENYGRDKNYDSIRLDSFKGNKFSNKLYEKSGYTNRGTVFFNQKPEGSREYFCFKKKL